MNWQMAIEQFNIADMYADAKLENCEHVGLKNLQLGLRWQKAFIKPSLFIHGKPGTGKTYFAMALFRSYIALGRHGLWVNSEDMDRELLLASIGKLTNSRGYEVYESQLIEKYSDCECLFLDDLGVEKNSERANQQYAMILGKRFEKRLPTVITSNLSIEEIGKRSGERLASRLKASHQLEFVGSDMRSQMAIPLI